MTAIEINGSFYALQKPVSYRQWLTQVPPGFRFSVKGPRFITHLKKLADARTPLAKARAVRGPRPRRTGRCGT